MDDLGEGGHGGHVFVDDEYMMNAQSYESFKWRVVAQNLPRRNGTHIKVYWVMISTTFASNQPGHMRSAEPAGTETRGMGNPKEPSSSWACQIWASPIDWVVNLPPLPSNKPPPTHPSLPQLFRLRLSPSAASTPSTSSASNERASTPSVFAFHPVFASTRAAAFASNGQGL